MREKANRETRHYKRVNAAILGQSAAHSTITASWRRSMLHHNLLPDQRNIAQTLTAGELREAIHSLDLLMKVARPALEGLFAAVVHSGCCVILSDTDGVILQRLATPGDLVSFDEWGLRTGAVWSESRQGTNGIGTCVVEERPVVIHKDQHFRSKNIGMTCMGAPLFDTKGKIMAVLDVSSAKSDLSIEMAMMISSLIKSTASKIESDLFRASFHDANIVIAHGFSALGIPLLASDKDDLVVGANRAARRLFDLGRDALDTPFPRSDLGEVTAESGLKSAERTVIRQAVAKANGNMSLAARELNVSRATFYRMLKKHDIQRDQST